MVKFRAWQRGEQKRLRSPITVLTPTQIHNNRLEQLRKKLEEEIEKNYELKNDLNYISSILNTLIHHLTC